MATLWHPTKRVHIEIIGGAFDGHYFDSDVAKPLERHFLSLMQDLAEGQELHSVTLRKVLELFDSRTVPTDASLSERYTVIARVETDGEVLIQMRHSYLPQET